MRERPILMSAPMVQAILARTKTQTRRVVKEPGWATPDTMELFDGMPWASDPLQGDRDIPCPYGVPGDRLWCRETWQYDRNAIGAKRDEDGPFVYAATDNPQHRMHGKWRPSIFMPRWASRITLEITEVRVERLQEISDADCFAEGIQQVTNEGMQSDGTARGTYRALWESINGAGSWDANPWVWVLTFRRTGDA